MVEIERDERIPMTTPLKAAVLLSGSGTTLQNLLDCTARGELPVQIDWVLSDRPGVKGLERAAAAGIAHQVIERKSCASLAEFGERVFRPIREAKVQLVIMGGFLRLLPIPDDYTHKVMNIHPSLIPMFCGKGFHGTHVHQAVIDSGAKVTGCTVHFADNEYDHGPIILQKVVEVASDDTASTLAQKVFQAECEAYPTAIRWFAENRIRVEGRRTLIRQDHDDAGWDA